MLEEKPYFTLYIDSYKCLGFILLNGHFMYGVEMDPLKLDLPVNHWIRKGDNELMFLFMPMDDNGDMEGEFAQGARCEATLYVRQSGTSSDDKIRISSLKLDSGVPEFIEGNSPDGRLDSKNSFAPDKKGDVKVGRIKRDTYMDQGLILSRKITLPKIGLPAWKFFTSDNLTELSGVDIEGRMAEEQREELKQELLPIYRKIWDALDKGDVDSILPLYEERSSETDAAFFKKPGETQSRVAEWLKESVSDPGQKLWPITDDNVMLRIYDNNKLAQLLQNNDSPLLSFDEPDAGIAHHYEAIFRRKGKKWILTR
jgi:hypothetical protein